MSGEMGLRAAIAFIDKHPDDWNPLLTVRQAREWVVAAKTVRAALSGSTAPLDRETLALALSEVEDGDSRRPSARLMQRLLGDADVLIATYERIRASRAASPDPAQGGAEG